MTGTRPLEPLGLARDPVHLAIERWWRPVDMAPPETDFTRMVREASKRALGYALTLTKNLARAEDLAQRAVLEALDPEKKPWDPSVHPDFPKYVCSLVLSRYGNEQKSYRLRKASHILTPEVEATAVDPSTPEMHALRVESEAEGDRRYEMLLARVVVVLPNLSWSVRSSHGAR
jgi:DNA-directed RNA polymerase specialized sigma24 family protein